MTSYQLVFSAALKMFVIWSPALACWAFASWLINRGRS